MLKVKIKKFLISGLLICSMFFAVFFAGCGYKGYTGKYADLYTVAVSSVLWNNGYYAQTERSIDPPIEILEKDSFGRVLYTYCENYYARGTMAFSALIVSQHKSDDYVYYYDNCNFLILEQQPYASQLEDFGQEAIDSLKAANDWGKELDLLKCTKKQITRNKQNIPASVEFSEEKVLTKFDLKERECYITFDLLTFDFYNNYLIYGLIDKYVSGDYIYFVAFIKYSDKSIDWLVPQDPYNYQEELNNLKAKNGWKN